ncbi:5'-nucleotidase-like isoform X2 [Stylophora pistillata]|uniref:5'-nucleotidase-like isoform X2 n=1 Tax=Stylophora pistillata TaxID=50429 RepID=UPI000C03AD25|nr:5'-nucleotidase-like isoform X2 [Stylophora pistillata]
MGCGSSKLENIPGDVNSHSQPPAIDGGTSNFQPATCEKNSEKPSDGVSQDTKVVRTSVKSAEQRDNCDGTKTATKSKQVTILHFNDVYNIEPRDKEPVGGAARFATKVASFKHLNPLIAFSGDCLNPSTMSSVTGGKQMIPILNALNVHVAVFGNHDFDFGVDELMEFSAATNCPWLLSNVIDNVTGKQLAGGIIKHIIEWREKKIGFIGLVEEEWLVTLATVDREEVTYFDFVTEGTKLAKELRQEGAEFVVALTHMREPNDRRLAEQVTGIDLILGGHDHDYFAEKINGIHVIKSGTDFREFSIITVTFEDNNNRSSSNNSFSIEVQRIEITSDIPEDTEVKSTVDKYVGEMNNLMEEVIGEVQLELDGRFSSMRTKETNLGNFITDIIQNVTEVDCVILNSGTLRSDTIHPPGKFKMKDLSAILPMPDVLVVLELTGDQILEALENGVSQWPKLEGRFPQVAGMKFSFNPDKDPGCRILEDSVSIDNEPLVKDKRYKVCTKSYLAKGKDGYRVFSKGKVLVDEEDGPILNTIVRNHFRSINIVRGVTKSKSSHRQSLVMRHRSSEIIDDGNQKSSLISLEKEHISISPKVEGRITMVTEADEEEKSDSLEPIESHLNGPEVEKTDQDQDVENSTRVALETRKNQNVDYVDTSDKTQPVENVTVTVETLLDNSMDKLNNDLNEDIISRNVQNRADSQTKEIKQHEEEGNEDQLLTAKVKPGKPEQRIGNSLGPDMATEDEYWDLWEAVKADDIDVVENLRKEKNIRFTRCQDNKTILHLGAERNAVKVVKYLLTDGKMDPNVKDEILQGVPLHGAAEYGSTDAARVLLEHGAEINRQDLIGNTALHIACEHEQGKIKTFLIDQGADKTIKNSDGETPANY